MAEADPAWRIRHLVAVARGVCLPKECPAWACGLCFSPGSTVAKRVTTWYDAGLYFNLIGAVGADPSKIFMAYEIGVGGWEAG